MRSLALAVAVFATLAASPAHAQFGANLVVNGNADLSAGSTDGTTGGALPGWTVSGPILAIVWDIPGGFPALNDSGPADRAPNLFAGNYSAYTSAAQTIDISAGAPAIDAGTAQYALSAWLGGFSSQNDHAVLTLFFESAAHSVLGGDSIGPVMAVDRFNATQLKFRSHSGLVPAGSRFARVTLELTRTDGSYNDGYADDLSLVLTASATAAGDPAAPLSGGLRVGRGADGTIVCTFALARPQRVALDVFDASGRHVRQLLARDVAAGPQRLVWDGRDAQGRAAPRGVYIVHLRGAGASARCVLLR